MESLFPVSGLQVMLSPHSQMAKLTVSLHSSQAYRPMRIDNLLVEQKIFAFVCGVNYWQVILTEEYG